MVIDGGTQHGHHEHKYEHNEYGDGGGEQSHHEHEYEHHKHGDGGGEHTTSTTTMVMDGASTSRVPRVWCKIAAGAATVKYQE